MDEKWPAKSIFVWYRYSWTREENSHPENAQIHSNVIENNS